MFRTCSIDGCERPFDARGMCKLHYSTALRRSRGAAPIPSLAGRFWEKVTRGDGCWEWSGATGTNGYARLWHDGRMIPASHVAWFLAHGQWPPADLFVCHHCDNPPCVRADHLFLGTKSDNMRDAAAKGRNAMQRHPERSSFARLSQERTTCGRGHPFSEANTRQRKDGYRECRICAQQKQRERRLRAV
jgi:hypothetical protein